MSVKEFALGGLLVAAGVGIFGQASFASATPNLVVNEASQTPSVPGSVQAVNVAIAQALVADR
jgi:hypothetical protein